MRRGHQVNFVNIIGRNIKQSLKGGEENSNCLRIFFSFIVVKEKEWRNIFADRSNQQIVVSYGITFSEIQNLSQTVMFVYAINGSAAQCSFLNQKLWDLLGFGLLLSKISCICSQLFTAMCKIGGYFQATGEGVCEKRMVDGVSVLAVLQPVFFLLQILHISPRSPEGTDWACQVWQFPCLQYSAVTFQHSRKCNL